MYHGWIPPIEKICVRCEAVHDDQLYLLCPACRREDEMEDNPRSEAERELDGQEENFLKIRAENWHKFLSEINSPEMIARRGTILTPHGWRKYNQIY